MLSAATTGTRFMASRSMTMKGVGLSSSTVSSTSSSSSVLLSSSQRHQFSSMFRSIQKNGTTLTATATTTAMKKQAAVARERLSSLLSSSSSSSKITKRNFFSRPDPEVLRSGLGPLKRNWKGIVGTLAVGTGILHSLYGNVDNFYDKRWILECDPDDLADFYGSENFMDLYCIFPFMITLMMRMSVFDDEGTVHTQGIPFGEMLVSMVFSDSDDDGDGGDSKWFNKRERFKNEAFGNRFLMYDKIENFGFEQLPDGRCMVYHHGEYWHSSLPPITLGVRAIFQIQAWIAAKTTEHHLTYYAFKNDTEVDETMETDSRHCMICFWLRNYNWFKVIGYMLMDRPLDMPNHLKKKRADAMALFKLDNPDEDEEEEEEEVEEAVIAATLARKKTIADTAMTGRLPVQRPNIMRQITSDIAMDRAIAKATLSEDGDMEDEDTDEDDETMEAIFASKAADDQKEGKAPMMAKKQNTIGSLRRIKTSTALKRFQTSLKKNPAASDENVKVQLQRVATKMVNDLSKLIVKDDAETTDSDAETNKDNYKAIGQVARAKMARRSTIKLARKSTMQVKADKLDKAIAFNIKRNRLDNAYGGYQ